MQSNTINDKSLASDRVYQGLTKLPFTLSDVKAAIPKDCFEPNLGKSFFFFFRDIITVGLLYALAYYFDSWLFFPIFWVMQGTMFWALFVVGHDCGHQSFSKHRCLVGPGFTNSYFRFFSRSLLLNCIISI